MVSLYVMGHWEAFSGVHYSFDASGSWGCGAYWNGQWFHLQWPFISSPLT